MEFPLLRITNEDMDRILADRRWDELRAYPHYYSDPPFRVFPRTERDKIIWRDEAPFLVI